MTDTVGEKLYFRQAALDLLTKWVWAVNERAGRRVPEREASSKTIHREVLINTHSPTTFWSHRIC